MTTTAAATACPICKSSNTRVYKSNVTSVYTTKPYSISACNNCQHRFTTPLPTAADLNAIYSKNYAYDAHFLIEPEKKKRARSYAKTIAQMEDVKSVLEVGCMHGFLVEGLSKQGLSAKGIDIDGEAVKICQDKGLDVTQSALEDYKPGKTERFDAIVMSHVLEHIVDPTAELSRVRDLLNPGGKLIIIVPNSLSKSARLTGKYWGYWQVPVHISHFNKHSIAKLFANTGYNTRRITFYGADSLFFLSTAANLLGARNEAKGLSPAKKLLVKIATAVLSGWMHVGSEDMFAVAIKK